MHLAVGGKASNVTLYPALALDSDLGEAYLKKRPQAMMGLKKIGEACPKLQVDSPQPPPAVLLPTQQPEEGDPLLLGWREEDPPPQSPPQAVILGSGGTVRTPTSIVSLSTSIVLHAASTQTTFHQCLHRPIRLLTWL